MISKYLTHILHTPPRYLAVSLDVCGEFYAIGT